MNFTYGNLNCRKRWLAAALTLAAGSPNAFAVVIANAPIFVPGNLLLSRSSYSANPASVPFPGRLVNGSASVANGSYPNVFNNETPDAAFGITSPILIDHLTPYGVLLNTFDVTGALAAAPSNGVSTIATSFPSKSELGLSMTPDGSAVTFMAYNSAINQLDVSNSNTSGHLDITNPVNAIAPIYNDRTIIELSSLGSLLATPTHAYSGNNGRNVVYGGAGNGNYFMVGNAGNNGGSTKYAAAGGVPTVALTVGSNGVTLTGSQDTGNLFIGTPFSGTGIPAGTYVTAVNSLTQFTVSNNATAVASGDYTANGATIQLPGMSFSAGNPVASITSPYFDTTRLSVSMPVTGTNVPAGAHISAIDPDKVHFTLSTTPVANSLLTASYTAGVPSSMLSDNTGVQMIARGSVGESMVVGKVNGSYGAATGYQRGFTVTQIGAAADKSGKDDNFRGATSYNSTVYVTKGSGGNGFDAVYQVNPNGGSYVSPGASAGLPTAANAAMASINALPGWPVTSTGANEKKMPITVSPDNTTPVVHHPFGIWFANDTTLYVGDEGGPTLANGAQGGLQKWIWNGSAWTLAYTLTNGAISGTVLANNKTGGVPYNVTDGVTTVTPTAVGLRNISGRVNGDGTVTVYAVTSTISSLVDVGADPNQLVAITDNLGYTTAAQAAAEQFAILKTAQYAEVLRGVAFVPGIAVARGGFTRDRRSGAFAQLLTVTNNTAATVVGPLFVALDGLSANATLANAAGTSGPSPYVVGLANGASLAPGQSSAVALLFADPSAAAITYSPRIVSGGTP